MMAKAQKAKNVIPIGKIKIDAGFRRNYKMLKSNPNDSRSQVYEMLENMLLDKAQKQDSFTSGRSLGAKAQLTKHILNILKSNPNDSSKELHRKCENEIADFEMGLSSFKTRISELRAEYQILKMLKKDCK
ncbi:hypothetical protein [Polynucleobacter sp. Tro8-14-1]|jgi:hypothetical protein|uniref:hypothetical protein n=1 Tax=Polynucleobacter sp. Tro8-14-1 TaxID=1758383 RepID=UPI001C0B7ED5|nr:hypothetical protein [Polynucleobacter sp. Tro8-14-1]MBU3562360.1 hypothetical protein [Polynucleobacter sp. Tro8-14-1]